ncbi:MAG: RsmE family RNA methyltransferase [Candidatus Eisenbacteria bacterium]
MKDKVLRHHLFYFSPDALDNDLISFPPGESRHMVSSLRLRKGDRIRATDGRGVVYEVVLEEARRKQVTGRIADRTEVECPGARVTVFQGAVKPAKMALMIEKCVELGVWSVIPVETGLCVSGMGEGRVKRLKRIAIEAMKQSVGAHLPDIHSLTPFDGALSRLSDFDLTVVAWEDEKHQRLKDIIGSERPGKVALWIGPEGGFTPVELDELANHGARTFSLGDRRLKAETAAIASLAVLNELLG